MIDGQVMFSLALPLVATPTFLLVAAVPSL